MADRDAPVEQFARMWLFDTLDRPDLERLAEAAHEATFGVGEVLMEQGRVGRECYFLVEGSGDVVVNDETVGAVGPGDAVGEMGLLDKRPRSATVVATSPVRSLVLGADDLDRCIESSPDIARAIIRGLSKRIRELDQLSAGGSRPAPRPGGS